MIRNLSWKKLLIIAAAVILTAGISSCRPPRKYLLRYHFQPGEVRRYAVSIQGDGRARISSPPGSKREEEISLPVRLTGAMTLEMEVKNLSPDGGADLELRYRDIDLTLENEVRERKVKIVLDEEGMETWDRGRLIKEIKKEDKDFPLRGILTAGFELQVDPRGRILKTDLPDAVSSNFQHFNLRELVEQFQPVLPAEEVEVGEQWRTTAVVTMPELAQPWDRGQEWKLSVASALKNVDDRSRALISGQGRLRQEWTGPEEKKRDQGGLKSFEQEMTRSSEFDLAAGRLVSSRTSLKQKFTFFMLVDKIVSHWGFDVNLDFVMNIDVKLQELPEKE